MKNRPKSTNPIATDDVKNMGGKDLILKRMVNHYKAIAVAKPKIDSSPPHQHVNRNKIDLHSDIHYKEQYYNVRQTYKKVANVRPVIDNGEPFTFNMAKTVKPGNWKEKFDDTEHIRRLNAMSKRILSIGKVEIY